MYRHLSFQTRFEKLNAARSPSPLGPRPGFLQRRRAGYSEPAAVPPIVHQVLRSPGQPLDRHARAFFEPCFGHDFSKVRVHADARAAESAQAVNALAYTVGGHIVFDSKQYAPLTGEGQKLLAHELTHVLQQRNAPDAPPLGLSAVADQTEREADLTASEVSCNSQGLHQAFPGSNRLGTSAPGGTAFCPNAFHSAASVVNEAVIPRRLPILTPAAGMIVQRKATFSEGTVHETRNAAEQIIKGDAAGVTLPLLNGAKLRGAAEAEAAIKEPEIQSAPKKGAGVECSLKTVPENVGSFDETVLSAGPWRFQTRKQDVYGTLQLPACRSAGDATVTAHGQPSDADVAKANRAHEDHHAADDERAFNMTIGEWDKKMTDAEKDKKVFEGTGPTNCEMALHAAMGGTPKSVADRYWGNASAAGDEFHHTAGGGQLRASNATSDPACDNVDIDIRQ